MTHLTHFLRNTCGAELAIFRRIRLKLANSAPQVFCDVSLLLRGEGARRADEGGGERFDEC
jgi:hypothetical protein